MANVPGPDIATSTGVLAGVAPFVFTTAIQVVPAVTAVAYAAGAVLGGVLAFPAASRALAGSGIAQLAACSFASGVVPSLDLILFNASPAGGTITNAVALAIATADLPKVLGVLHLTDAVLLGASAPSLMQAPVAALPFKLPAGSNTLYGVLVTRTAVTLGSTTDATITLFVMQD
jgi:hypothetical protein